MPRLRLVFALFLAALAPAGAAEKPNVLFLLADDMRADAVGALGNSVVQTPNLDGLVARGFTFTNAYCQGSTVGAVCNPSRHMILSGRSLYRYDPKKIEGTFADALGKAGYETWHLGKRGNTPHEYHKAFDRSAYLKDDEVRKSGQHGKAAADGAIDYLKARKDYDKPFFMYLAFAGPHDPRVAAPAWRLRYEVGDMPLPKNFAPFHPFDNGDLLVRDEQLLPWPRTKDAVREETRDYYGCITSIDANIGRILSTLKDQGELDKTLVVFAADHGLAMGSHGLLGKQSLYDHSMKAPLVFAGPGVPHGASDALAYLYDIYPTVADFAGAKPPADIDGKSLAPVIGGESRGVRDTIFLTYLKCQRAVRRGDWKLIRYPLVNVTQLFDLKHDPDEMHDLAGDPAEAGRVRDLLSLLREQQKYFGDTAPLAVETPKPAAVDAAKLTARAAAKKGKK
jgi:arylsulfatase A-like enzyme